MLQIVHNKVDRDSILFSLDLRATPWYYNVCIFHRWLDEFDKGRFYEPVVRLEDAFDGPATLHYVPQHTPRQTNVIICMHENLQIEQIIDLLIVKAEDALEDYQGRPLA